MQNLSLLISECTSAILRSQFQYDFQEVNDNLSRQFLIGQVRASAKGTQVVAKTNYTVTKT